MKNRWFVLFLPALLAGLLPLSAALATQTREPLKWKAIEVPPRKQSEFKTQRDYFKVNVAHSLKEAQALFDKECPGLDEIDFEKSMLVVVRGFAVSDVCYVLNSAPGPVFTRGAGAIVVTVHSVYRPGDSFKPPDRDIGIVLPRSDLRVDPNPYHYTEDEYKRIVDESRKTDPPLPNELCPNCGSDDVVLVFYGIPSPKVVEQIGEEKIIVGHYASFLEKPEKAPRRACKKCRKEWR